MAVALTAGILLVWPGSRSALFHGSNVADRSRASSAPAAPVFVGWSNPAMTGKPYGSKVNGILTFRGNPTRTYYGTGPIPRTAPKELWRFPKSGGLCAISSDAEGPREWCGSGWTGQPAVFERNELRPTSF